MGGYKLETTEEERDLGVTRTSKLKPSVQCAKAARTAQMVLGQITRAFHFRDKHVFVQLYKTQLEFAIQAWSPWSQADKEFLGKSAWQRAVKQISGLKQANYNERLKKLGMLTLEERRHQAGMIMTYKILTGKEDVDPSEWFVMAAEAVRSDPLQCESETWATGYQEAFLLCKSDRGLECSPKSDKWIENGERIKRCICKIPQKHCPIRLRLVIQLQED